MQKMKYKRVGEELMLFYTKNNKWIMHPDKDCERKFQFSLDLIDRGYTFEKSTEEDLSFKQ